MHMYLLIFIELVVLYAVFWAVFLREPKNRKISGGLWGSYGKNQELEDNELKIESSLNAGPEFMQALEKVSRTEEKQKVESFLGKLSRALDAVSIKTP